MARPKKEKDKMLHKLTIRYSDQGITNVRKNALNHGLDVTSYIRAETEKIKPVKPRVTQDEMVLYKELIGATNNLNQIAKHFNIGNPLVKDLTEVLAYFKSIIDKLR